MTMKLHAYCINLASDKLRKSHCEQEYAKTNISFEFIEAVDGREQNVAPEAANSGGAANTLGQHRLNSIVHWLLQSRHELC